MRRLSLLDMLLLGAVAYGVYSIVQKALNARTAPPLSQPFPQGLLAPYTGDPAFTP